MILPGFLISGLLRSNLSIRFTFSQSIDHSSFSLHLEKEGRKGMRGGEQGGEQGRDGGAGAVRLGAWNSEEEAGNSLGWSDGLNGVSS